MSVSITKIGQIVTITIIIITITFCIFDSYNLKQDIPFHDIKNNFNITNILDIKINSSSAHDYNQLFSNYVKKDYHKLSRSTKKLTMLFTIGIEGVKQNLFSSIFNESAKTDPDHIIHLSYTSQISKYLHQCWSFDLWDAKKKNYNYCDMIQEKFNEISFNSPTNTVLLSSIFFPLNNQYPDIVQLIEWAQNAVPYPIDLRLLILNKDLNDSLSICLSLNDCAQRIPLMSHILNSMHSQIMQIDPLFWTQINYTDFMQNTMKYTPIFKSLMDVEEDKITKAFRAVMNSMDDRNDAINTQSIQQHFNALQLWSIDESYYSDHVKSRWPLFQKKAYTLNLQLMHQIHVDYNDIYSNYIQKDYNLLNKSVKKLKMVFIVGVEGVGHHFFRSIFNALQTLDDIHYVHQNDRPWPKDPLWLIMDQCFAFDFWGLVKPPSWLTVDVSILPKNEQNMRICDVVQKRINEYSETMRNNSILFISTHYSFPYDDPVVNRYPDFVKFIEWAQNAKPYAFDVRILVLNRDYKTSIISTCVKRFGQCTERIPLLANMLNVIHAELLQIDQEFWLQINYTDLVDRAMDYVPILSTFFNVKLENIRKAIEITTKQYKQHKQHRGTHREQLNKEQLWAINTSYYSSHIQNRWPLFKDSYYIVRPENDNFLEQKLFVSNRMFLF